MPVDVKHHLGVYRKDTKLIYRNLYNEYTTSGLRNLLAHEFAHHIWFSSMTPGQREQWQEHLERNPSPVQVMVRRVYGRSADFAAEDFAFTVESARPVDINELAVIGLITVRERDTLLAAQSRRQLTLASPGCAHDVSGPDSGSGSARVAPH